MPRRYDGRLKLTVPTPVRCLVGFHCKMRNSDG